MALPDGLQAEGPPAAPAMGEGMESKVKYRAITHEENINRQLDRIAYLRSAGFPWGEAVYQLRDMVVGLEDEQFWDGIPEHVREKLDKEADGYAETLEVLKERFAEHSWENHSVRAFRRPDGRVVYRPTNEDLSKALRIVMQLLARRGIVWKRKTRTRFGPWGEILDEATGGT